MSVCILWKIIKKQREKIVGLKKVYRLLGERCTELLKDKGDLTDRLEDLQEHNSEMFNTIALQEQQIEKMKSDVISERDKAKCLEDVITYTVLNDILAKWEIEK